MTRTNITVVVNSTVVVVVRTRRRLSLRECLLTTCSFSRTTRAASAHVSAEGSRSTSGVPSAGQKAEAPSP
ncbi:MAG TPA: hypothetical protein VGX48_15900 [Pyrinomonadaceae bacterium]|nr:hypothetical protein [Pyrinomonadaceae bacterium]